MKNLLSFFFMILVLFWTISAISAEKNGEATIESIHFQEKNDSEIITVKLSSRVIPRVFELNGDNPRVVCDFYNTGYPANKRRVIAAGGDLIKRVRVGLHHMPVVKTRIVIDLEESAVFSLVRDFGEGQNNLIIRIWKKSKQLEEPQDTTEPVAVSPVKEEETAEIPTSSLPPDPVDGDNRTSPGIREQTEDEPDIFENGIDAFQDSSETEGAAEEGQTAREELENRGFAALHDITFERSTNDKEMVLFKLNGFYPPIVFSTEENDLLVVCDFLDAVLAIGIDPLIETKGEYIKKIRISTHRDPNKVRVVLELAENYNYDLKQVFFKEDNLFVIIISNLGEK